MNRTQVKYALSSLLVGSVFLTVVATGAPSEGIKALARAENPELISAAMDGNITQIEVYVSKGGDINVTNRFGQTALMWASTYNHRNVVQWLLDKGAKVDLKDQKHGRTALLYATRSDRSEIVPLLLAKGADVEVKDSAGYTPLVSAVIGGCTNVLTVLLNNKADVNVADNQGMTPLMWAVLRSQSQALDVLLQHKANVSLKDRKGNTALYYAHEPGIREQIQAYMRGNP